MSSQRDPFWWPEAWEPRPEIVIPDHIVSVLHRETRAAAKERLERMAIIIGQNDGNAFVAQRVLDHNACSALGFIRARKRGLLGFWLIRNIPRISTFLQDSLNSYEYAILSHSHPHRRKAVTPSSDDLRSATRAEAVFALCKKPSPRFTMLGYAHDEEGNFHLFPCMSSSKRLLY